MWMAQSNPKRYVNGDTVSLQTVTKIVGIGASKSQPAICTEYPYVQIINIKHMLRVQRKSQQVKVLVNQ